MKILVAYDGTLNAGKALRYGLTKLQKQGGELTVLQVFDRAVFVDYDAGPQAEELARREARQQLAEAKKIAAGQGALAVRFIEKEGPAEEVILDHIAEDGPDLVIAPPRYRSLSKRSSRPVSVIPGTVLVPVDSSGALSPSVPLIAEEASASSSPVTLLGLVPVHLYSAEERSELAAVTDGTSRALRSLGALLAEQGLSVTEIVRKGYPDEEILKAADELQASVVVLPSGSSTPSELTKAAAILLEEPERLHWPVLVLPATA